AAVVLGTRLSIDDKLHIKVAEQLGLLGQEFDGIKEHNDEQGYYAYDMMDATDLCRGLLKPSIVPQIIQKLSTKRYLLMIENLDEPTKPIKLDNFTEDLCLPAPMWKGSLWHISTTTRDVYDRSKPDDHDYIISYSGDDIVVLIP